MSPSSSSSPPPRPRVVGRYVLYDEIASGGMATVHVGRLMGPVGFSRTVAIKRLHPQYAKEPDFVSMFLDEARLAARIRHPNVVGTLDIVATEGELFLVMEYILGESLARLMRVIRDRGERGDHGERKGVPVAIAVAIIVGVLEGLHAAHEAKSDLGEPLGIVHRDVSPQNILVGSDGVARVVDFGVAKAVGRVQSTRDGQLKGKLGYMAPEQINGQTTRATDVHAASVVLWEMLTARRLHQTETELQTFSSILEGTSIVAPSTHAPDIPPDLDVLVLKGLSPRPEARFESAREMARALQRAVSAASSSDVGDWVEATAGANIHTRARKIAAIESSGMLPVEAVTDGRESAAPMSHPPVSAERRRSDGPAMWKMVVPALALLVLLLGTTIGVLVRSPAPRAGATEPSAPQRAAAGSLSAPALGTWTESERATGFVLAGPLGARAAEARPPPRAGAGAQTALPPGYAPARPQAAMPPPVSSQQAPPQVAPSRVSASPAPWQPGGAESGGSDFSHVMDSRK